MKFKKLAAQATSFVLTAGMLVTGFGSFQTVRAADHRDSLAVDALAEGDFTDVFAFIDPANNNNVVLSFLVNPFTNPAEGPSERFSEEYLYQMKIDNNSTVGEDLVVQVAFEGGRGPQHYEVTLGTPSVTGPRGNKRLTNGTKLCTGNFVYNGNAAIPIQDRNRFIVPSGTLPNLPPYNGGSAGTADVGGVQCFAGVTDDSFQTDVAQAVFRIGLNADQTENALNHTQDVFRGFTSTSFGPLRGRPLRADGTSGSDGFGGYNASAVAVSVPKSLLTGTGIRDVSTGNANPNLIGVWGTVSRPESETFDGFNSVHVGDTFAQFERMGQQLANTVWVFRSVPLNETTLTVAAANACIGVPGYISTASLSTAQLKDLHNATGPETDDCLFRRYTPTSLRSNAILGSLGPTIEGRATLLTAGGFTVSGVTGTPLLTPQTSNPNLALNQNQNLQKDLTWPDFMRLNVNQATDGVRGGAATAGNSSATLGIGRYGYQNGRRPADDVTDIYLRIARELTDVQFGPNVLLGGAIGGNPLPGYQPNTDPTRRPLRCETLNVSLDIFGTPALLTPCEDARIFAVLQGTDWIESSVLDINNVANQVSQQRALEASFPYFGFANPIPGEAGTSEFPPQQ